MTIHQAGEVFESGTDMVLTLKHGYDEKGFANTIPILFKAGDYSKAVMIEKAKGFADNADDFVICEA
jgi:hypothetical protein